MQLFELKLMVQLEGGIEYVRKWIRRELWTSAAQRIQTVVNTRLSMSDKETITTESPASDQENEESSFRQYQVAWKCKIMWQ